jgi:hypothetical protein
MADDKPNRFFELGEPLLARLRERREATRRAEDESGATRTAARANLHIGALMSSGASREDIPALAQALVDDMRNLRREVEDQHDAFLLDPGMGPMVYLTADGRILVDGRTWDGEPLHEETSEDNATAALVVGAQKTGLGELLDLVRRLDGATPCPTCNATRWMPIADTGAQVVCPVCYGRAEIDERLRPRVSQFPLRS